MDQDDQLIIFGDFVKGTCEFMCPLSERKMREREKLLHPLERLLEPNLGKAEETNSGQAKLHVKRNPNYLADPNRIVKEFSRSAAGHKMPTPSDLRPFPVLDMTVSYLIEKIACSKIETSEWVDRYNFVTDRLRAVRQDMVIQGLPPLECIKLLEPMVKFHVFAGYWLCEKQIHIYDPKMNSSFLQECITRLLAMYDAVRETKSGTIPRNTSGGIQNTASNARCDCTEHLIYALYLVINLGNPQTLNQVSARILNAEDCQSCVQQRAFRMSLSLWRGNYVSVCRSIRKLAPLQSMAAAVHLPTIRRHALMVMTTAFSNKVLKFPVAELQEILLWEHEIQALKECQYYGIAVEKSEDAEVYVQFQKGSFNLTHKPVMPSRLSWLDKNLSNSSVATLIANV